MNGHAFTQRSQVPPPVHGRHMFRSIVAVPITASRMSMTRSAPDGHDGMHGASSQTTHGLRALTSRKGVPAATPAFPSSSWIASTGHAFTHSPQRVHATRNDASTRAPGGRCTCGVSRSATRSIAASAACAPAWRRRSSPRDSTSRFDRGSSSLKVGRGSGLRATIAPRRRTQRCGGHYRALRASEQSASGGAGRPGLARDRRWGWPEGGNVGRGADDAEEAEVPMWGPVGPLATCAQPAPSRCPAAASRAR